MAGQLIVRVLTFAMALCILISLASRFRFNAEIIYETAVIPKAGLCPISAANRHWNQGDFRELQSIERRNQSGGGYRSRPALWVRQIKSFEKFTLASRKPVSRIIIQQLFLDGDDLLEEILIG